MIWVFLAGAILGACLGIVAMCLCIISSYSDGRFKDE